MTDREQEIAELRRRLAALEAEGTSASGAMDSPPQPATRAKSGRGVLFSILGVCALLIVVAMVRRQGPMPNPSASSAAAADATAAAAAPTPPAAPAPEPGSNWTYSDDKDAMTDKVTHTACTTSKNEITQSAPYRDTDARLCLRRSPKYGVDAFVTLNSDGQILCSSYEGCTIHVRYDTGPRQAASASGPSDNSSETVFFTAGRKVIERLRHTNRFLVEIELFQNGEQSLEFDTSDLKWP